MMYGHIPYLANNVQEEKAHAKRSTDLTYCAIRGFLPQLAMTMEEGYMVNLARMACQDLTYAMETPTTNGYKYLKTISSPLST
jgi:hypothetical protein